MQASNSGRLHFFILIVSEWYMDIIGKRIKLKQFSFSQEEKKLYKKWFSNSIIKKQMGYIGEFDERDIERWKKSQQAKTNQMLFNIVMNQSERIIGMASITLERDKKVGEIEILIGEENYQNRGLGTETMKLLVSYCFIELHLETIKLRVLKENIKAINCYKKVGFVCNDTQVKKCVEENNTTEMVIMNCSEVKYDL